MTHVSKLLLGTATIALLGGCSMFKSDSASSSSSSSSPSRTAAQEQSTAPTANTTPMTNPAPETADTHAAAATPASPAPAEGIALSEVKNPKETLANVTVKDSKGEAIGEVKSVKVATNGKLTSIRVAVGTRTVALKLSTLKFMQAENTIVSQQSKAQIQKIR